MLGRPSLPPSSLRARLSYSWQGVDRSTPFWIAIALGLVGLVAVPIAWIAFRSLQGPGLSGWTVEHYINLFANPKFVTPVYNSLKIAVSSAVLAVVVGSVMAWLVARTDMPGREFFRTMVLASFVTPPFLSAIAWTMLGSPNAGAINQLFRSITGATGPLFNVYSIGGVIFVSFLYVYSYVFILIANSLDQISSDQEEAARILGGSRWRVAASVTLPLVLPAILSGFLLAFVHSISLFGVPAVLALPARIHTMTTQMWTLFQFPPRIELAAALAMPMLVVTAFLLWLQRKLLGRRSYATVVGKSVARQKVNLGVWRWPAFLFMLSVIILAIGLPFAVLIKAAVSAAWARPLTLENFTLSNFGFIFKFSATKTGIINSLKYGALAATGATALASLVAYVVRRDLVRGARVLEFLANAPIAIPGIVLGAGLFMAYTRPPFVLYGTMWILVIAYITLEFPFAFTQANTMFRAIHPELEEASRVAGASRIRTLFGIVAPLARNGLIAAWSLVFVASIRELSASILLFTSPTRVLSVVIFDLLEEGLMGPLAAMGVLLLGTSGLVVYLSNRLSDRKN